MPVALRGCPRQQVHEEEQPGRVLTAAVETSIATALGDEDADLVPDGLHGAVVEAAEATAAAVDAKGGGARGEEHEQGSLHVDVSKECSVSGGVTVSNGRCSIMGKYMYRSWRIIGLYPISISAS